VNCDDCKHYHWYYDYCDKWDCEIDARACNSCFEVRNAEKWNTTKEVKHACVNKKAVTISIEKAL